MAAVDTAHLAAFAGVPQTNVDALLSEPTVDLVSSFLQTLSAVAQNHDRLKSENLRLSVEYENAVRSSETKAQGLRDNADKALKEVDSLRSKLNAEESSRVELERRLENLQNSSNTSTSEVQGLQTRVKQLERSNRDTLALLEAKSTAHDKLAEDLTAQHQKTLALRREVSTLQERLTAAENDVSSAKFKESSLQQEIELLKRNNEWLDSEIKTKAAEHSKYRKEKSARLSELQRQNEDNHTTIESLRKTESTLRKRLDETAAKADEAFAKVQRLQEEASRQEEAFRAELDSARRLASLQEQSATTAKLRVTELNNDIESTKQDAVYEVGLAQAELESERQLRAELERKIEELEVRIESSEPAAAAVAPITPRGNRNALGVGVSTPRAASPFTPGTARSRGGLTVTQVYDEYNQVRAELAAEKSRNEKLSATVDEMIRSLEEKGPELEELEGERLHLTNEVDRLTTALRQASSERDTARKDSRKFESQVDGFGRETELLRQQLRDLSAQIKMLLAELQIRSDGSELSIEERQQLQQAAYGDTATAFEGMTDTGRFISQNLVLFKNLFELQDNNVKLLHLTRTLGEQMEGEEARSKQNQQEIDQQELRELRDKVTGLQDEIKSVTIQSQSYIQERDMFRRMLSHRGPLPQDAGDMQAMFGHTLNGIGSPGPSHQGDQTGDFSATTRQLSEQTKLLRELQSHFDTYRQEASTDHKTLRSQLDSLAKDKADLQSELARINSQLTLARERYEMLQSNYAYMESESEEARKRTQALAESAAKQDLRTQQVAEELVEAKAIADSMRNETANLKAEKDLWKRIEARLQEDNRSLTEERGRLNRAIADSQSLANERELADSESRRRLESQVESLETDLRSSSRKLEEALEEKKRDDLRREYETEQNRTRIDDLVKSLANTKEELSAAKTARDQTQARVEELKIDLRNAEERAQALQPRLTARSAAPQESSEPAEDALTREQELAVEVADLKRELDLTKGELENAKIQVEQYKQISQSAEEELQSINETQEQYRLEMDRIAAEKDAKIQQFEQRVQDISSELSVSNQQLSELRTTVDENDSRFEQQRTIYESELARVKDESESHLENARFHQDDLKAQAEIAQQAQRNYEGELVKHAEAAKALQKVRSDYNEIKLEVSKSRADAEAARTQLTQNEESWTAEKERYEKELGELKQRRDDVDKQNKILHQQLDNVSTQISTFQQRRNSGGNDASAASGDDSATNYQEVVRYLRREKEIVDVQYELSIQEARRLKQQLEYAQSQLDETRIKLDQERRQQVEQGRTSSSHTKLMETLNELNVYRESSVTLRNELRQNQAQLSEKSKRVEELIAQIEPLQTDLRTKQSELETAQGEIVLAKEDRDRWQARMQNILQKYDRVDPAELEGLKDQVTKLEQERDAATTEQQALQERINGLTEEVKQASEAAEIKFKDWKDRVEKQFKGRSKDQNDKIKALTSERDTVKAQLETAQTELITASTARDEALAQIQTLTAQLETQPQSATQAAAVEEGEAMETELTQSTQTDTSALQASLSAAQEQLKQESERAGALQQRVSELEQQAEQLRNEMQSHGTDEHLEKLKVDLENAQHELEALRASGPPTATTETPAGEITARLEEEYQRKTKQLEENTKQRSDQMKDQLNKKLAESRQKIREDAAKEREDALSKLKQEHEENLKVIKEEHASELDRVKSEASGQNAQGDGTAGEQSAEATSSTAPPATENAFNADSTPNVKPSSDSFVPPPGWEPPVELVRGWINSVPAVKDILKRNIQNKTAAAVEESKRVSAAEIEELKKKSVEARERAVQLEQKKQAVKLSSAEGRARAFQAKIDVVQKAATETPERPVGEVWTIAKDAKAAPATPAKPTATPLAAATPAQTKTVAAPTTEPTPTVQPAAAASAAAPAKAEPAAATPAAAAAGNANGATTQAAPATGAPAPTAGGPVAQGARRPSMSRGGGSAIPRGSAGGLSIRGGAATGRGGLPVASGQATSQGAAQAGSGIPRGGAAAAGRARGTATLGRGGAATRGALNPAAGTFAPGTKRPRDDSAGGPGNVENGGKRQRGGAGGT